MWKIGFANTHEELKVFPGLKHKQSVTPCFTTKMAFLQTCTAAVVCSLYYFIDDIYATCLHIFTWNSLKTNRWPLLMNPSVQVTNITIKTFKNTKIWAVVSYIRENICYTLDVRMYLIMSFNSPADSWKLQLPVCVMWHRVMSEHAWLTEEILAVLILPTETVTVPAQRPQGSLRLNHQTHTYFPLWCVKLLGTLLSSEKPKQRN